MAQSTGRKLDSGDVLPELQLQTLDGGATSVAALTRGKWSVVLLYRGDW